jgi:hypothetical protein
MSYREYSLRALVDKWLGHVDCAHMQITNFSHGRTKHRRFVQVMAIRPSGTLEFVFFRHDDGSWGMFPPNDRGPMMTFSRTAA